MPDKIQVNHSSGYFPCIVVLSVNSSLTDTSYKMVRFNLVEDIENDLVSTIGNDEGIKGNENEYTKLLLFLVSF
jgi:hypothetical protein